MAIVFSVLYLATMFYFLLLMGRLVFDWIQTFARDWRPRGAALVGASVIYRATDPPLRKLRSWIPPLRLGSISLDIGFLLLLVALGIAMSVTLNLAT